MDSFSDHEWLEHQRSGVAHPEAVAPFVTDNRRYRVDVDTPEDLERFERETGHVLRWPAGLAA